MNRLERTGLYLIGGCVIIALCFITLTVKEGIDHNDCYKKRTGDFTIYYIPIVKQAFITQDYIWVCPKKP